MDNPMSRLTGSLDGKPKADPLTWSEGQDLCHIWKNMLVEGQGWSPDPPCLSAPILHSDLKICWSNT